MRYVYHVRICFKYAYHMTAGTLIHLLNATGVVTAKYTTSFLRLTLHNA